MRLQSSPILLISTIEVASKHFQDFTFIKIVELFIPQNNFALQETEYDIFFNVFQKGCNFLI